MTGKKIHISCDNNGQWKQDVKNWERLTLLGIEVFMFCFLPLCMELKYKPLLLLLFVWSEGKRVIHAVTRDEN